MYSAKRYKVHNNPLKEERFIQLRWGWMKVWSDKSGLSIHKKYRPKYFYALTFLPVIGQTNFLLVWQPWFVIWNLQSAPPQLNQPLFFQRVIVNCTFVTDAPTRCEYCYSNFYGSTETVQSVILNYLLAAFKASAQPCTFLKKVLYDRLYFYSGKNLLTTTTKNGLLMIYRS